MIIPDISDQARRFPRRNSLLIIFGWLLLCVAIPSTAQDSITPYAGTRVADSVPASASSSSPSSPSPSSSPSARGNGGSPLPADVPPVVHSKVGDQSPGIPGKLKLKNIGKFQQFSGSDRASFDEDISSPKSVTFNADGSRFYVNSLEGGRTAVYLTDSLRKLRVIHYNFDSGQSPLWAPPSGFYPFTHYPSGPSRPFMGKPVESAWSHGGRYLWIPFYRRSFDINAQDPSAIAVIDSHSDSIIRMFETGPLPKMVAASPDGALMAITHWGDNTIGLIDISSPDPAKWRHLPPMVAGHKFTPDFPLDTPVNRDSGSGYLLRGTVFSPDSRFLFVSAMGGPLSVFDAKARKFIGHVHSLYGIRHLVIHDDFLYGSMNVAGMVVKVSLSDLIRASEEAAKGGAGSIKLISPVRHGKVDGGPRTLEISPDGRFLFVACNSASSLCVMDAQTLTVVDRIQVDSYPVGLALSPDGRLAVVTSQGRKGFGGNAVNVFAIERPDLPLPQAAAETVAVDSIATVKMSPEDMEPDHSRYFNKRITGILILIGVFIVGAVCAWIMMHRRK